MSAPFMVNGRAIGPGAPVFVVAEAGVNHNGSLDMARRLIDVAVAAGADAVKFQTFDADALVSDTAPTAAYQREATGGAARQKEMLEALELDAAAHVALCEHARVRGILFFSTPFDESSADRLEALGVPLFKVPSGEITNLPILRHLAAKKRPLIVSTGMATMDEIVVALDTLRAAGDPPVALLHCVSAYPAPPAEMNLRAMDTLAARFGCAVGLSDHTLGLEISIAAVARGAAIVEKHFTLDKGLPGPDHRASLDPDELAGLVRAIRAVESALGDGVKRPMPSEADTRRVARKSLVAARALRAGERLTPDRVAIKRPGTGIPPTALEQALGRVVRRDLRADEVIEWSALSEP